jgi:1-acyl-sn-glycerol-3-phosphate acyltransferase
MSKVKKIVRHNWFINLIKKIIRWVRKEPELVIQDNLPDTAIYYANHSGAAGPLTLSVYFPRILVPWGAYPMTGNYFARWKYLYYVFYRQKIGYSKLRSFILATLFGLISKILYNGVKLIPTYPDARLRNTIRESIEHLKVKNSLLIFPEDSSLGYKEEIASFHSGIVFLAKQYYKDFNNHIPIVPLYYNKAKQQIITGKTLTLADFPDNSHRNEIANLLRLKLNELSL